MLVRLDENHLTELTRVNTKEQEDTDCAVV